LHAQLFESAFISQGLRLGGNLGDEMGQHILGLCTEMEDNFKENEVLRAVGENNTDGDERNEKAE
jgi:hypothetical protein